MNREETLKIMAVLKAAYPNYYRGMTPKDATGIVGLWQEMFDGDPYELVAAAVKALLASDEKGFPPHIGAVKTKLRSLTDRNRMTEGEAWGLVRTALSRSLYRSREEFDKLPKEIQRLVGSPNQLREWAMMDVDTVQSVIASNFQRSYRAREASDREYEALPADVKALVNGQVSGSDRAEFDCEKMRNMKNSRCVGGK